jgi:hypothetical protein
VPLGLRAEAQGIDQLQRVTERIAAAELVLDLAEDLADLVLDRVRAGGAGAEALKVGEQLAIDIVDQVRAGQRPVMVERAIRLFGRGPDRPAVRVIDDVAVGSAMQLGFERTLLFQVVEIF